MYRLATTKNSDRRKSNSRRQFWTENK